MYAVIDKQNTVHWIQWQLQGILLAGAEGTSVQSGPIVEEER